MRVELVCTGATSIEEIAEKARELGNAYVALVVSLAPGAGDHEMLPQFSRLIRNSYETGFHEGIRWWADKCEREARRAASELQLEFSDPAGNA